MPVKLYWKVGEAPTGQHRSFHKRGWPTAYFDKAMSRVAVQIQCEDSYRPSDAREGTHAELKVYIASYACIPFRWLPLKKRAKTLAEAKELASKFFSGEAGKSHLPLFHEEA